MGLGVYGGKEFSMRSIRSAGAVLMLTGTAALAGTAAPAFAAGPGISVESAVVAPGGPLSVAAECRGTKPSGDAKSATFFGTTLGLAERIPMTASKTEAGLFYLTVKLPAGILPGRYSPSVDCSNGMSGTVTFTVASAKPAVVKPAVVVPSGAPVTGDGITSTAVGGPLTAVGVGILGLSGLFGAVFAIRRRKAGATK
jgi:hypothetical protein